MKVQTAHSSLPLTTSSAAAQLCILNKAFKTSQNLATITMDTHHWNLCYHGNIPPFTPLPNPPAPSCLFTLRLTHWLEGLGGGGEWRWGVHKWASSYFSGFISFAIISWPCIYSSDAILSCSLFSTPVMLFSLCPSLKSHLSVKALLKCHLLYETLFDPSSQNYSVLWYFHFVLLC